MQDNLTMAVLNSRQRGPFRVEECPIKSKRYEPLFPLGEGTWGTVYAARDTFTGEEVALKALTPSEIAEQQRQHRKLSRMEIMQKEAGFRASRNVLPRMYELDDASVPFLVMPICPSSLGLVLKEDNPRGSRNSINNGYPEAKRGYGYMLDIFSGMSELHNLYRKKHGDWKPDNIMLDEQDRAIINDLGASSCISGARTDSPRDNIGHLQTRAPERFLEGSRTEVTSDIYGGTALCYRIHTGEYPLEEEFEVSCKVNVSFLD